MYDITMKISYLISYTYPYDDHHVYVCNITPWLTPQ